MKPLTTTEAIQQVINSYNELKNLYIQIFKTYEEQREAFENEDEEQFQIQIDQRSNLIEQVDKLTEQITEAKNKIGDEILLDNELKQVKLSIKNILEETIELDKKLTVEIKIALGENRQKRQDLQQGKKVFNAYNQNQPASLFMDKKK